MTRIPTPTFRRGDAPSAGQFNRLAAAVPQVSGDGRTMVSRLGSRVTVGTANTPWPLFPIFMGRVLSSTLIAPNQWEYQIVQVGKSDTGYAVTEEYPNAYKGVAYNMLELDNKGSGVQGNGVNVDQLPGGFSLGPIPSGAWPHPVYLWKLSSSPGHIEFWLYYANPVVGVCT